jgi:outer membrane protein
MGTRTVISAMALIAILAGNALAGETTGQTESKKSEWSVGAGAVVASKPHRGVSSKLYPVPLLAYEGERLYLRGIAAGYRVFMGERWAIGPIVRPRFEGYDADDSSALTGMRDRDPSVDAGVDFSWRADWGLLSLAIVTDLLGRHSGQEVEFSYTALFPYGGFEFIPSAGVRWRSSSLVDYYYGVRAEEAAAGRPAYEAGDTITPVVRLAVRRKLSAKWSVLGAAQYEWFGSEITDSPIVEDDYIMSFMIGLAYSF